MKKSEQEIFLIEKINKNELFTSWHWNEDFLEFCDKFYRDKPIRYCRTKLTYYMRKLVASGVVEKSIKTGLGDGGKTTYGVNYQTSWYKKGFFDK